MPRYIIARLLSLIPVLIGASIFAFALARVAPGDVTTVLLGPYAGNQQRQELIHQLGLDKPLPVQYWRWLDSAAHGNLGTSVQLQTPVSTVLVQKFKNTLILGCAVFLVALVLGITAGFVSATHPGGLLDRGIQGMTGFFAYMPVFLLGVILVYVFSVRLAWLPSGGMGPAAGGGGVGTTIQHLVLPVLATVGIPTAIIAKSSRNALRAELGADFVRTARARGLKRRKIMRTYVFRVALPSILHVSGLQLAYLLTGSLVFTEVVFSWPGIGLQVYDAVTSRDIPVIQGVVLLAAVVTVLINLAVDVLHGVVDPRTREVQH